jgi:hypothetical protein
MEFYAFDLGWRQKYFFKSNKMMNQMYNFTSENKLIVNIKNST